MLQSVQAFAGVSVPYLALRVLNMQFPGAAVGIGDLRGEIGGRGSGDGCVGGEPGLPDCAFVAEESANPSVRLETVGESSVFFYFGDIDIPVTCDAIPEHWVVVWQRISST